MSEDRHKGEHQIIDNAVLRNHAHVNFVSTDITGITAGGRGERRIVKGAGLSALIIAAHSNGTAVSLVNGRTSRPKRDALCWTTIVLYTCQVSQRIGIACIAGVIQETAGSDRNIATGGIITQIVPHRENRAAS